jgi:hypothetical protein
MPYTIFMCILKACGNDTGEHSDDKSIYDIITLSPTGGLVTITRKQRYVSE